MRKTQFSTDIKIKRLQSELHALQRTVVKDRKIKISLCLFDIPTENMDVIELKDNSLTIKGKVNSRVYLQHTRF